MNPIRTKPQNKNFRRYFIAISEFYNTPRQYLAWACLGMRWFPALKPLFTRSFKTCWTAVLSTASMLRNTVSQPRWCNPRTTVMCRRRYRWSTGDKHVVSVGTAGSHSNSIKYHALHSLRKWCFLARRLIVLLMIIKYKLSCIRVIRLSVTFFWNNIPYVNQ